MSAAFFMMRQGVAPSAKRGEIVEHIVALFSRGRNAHPVPVMNVQVMLAATALASVIVAFQSGGTVAAEGVIVLCLLAVFCGAFWIVLKPAMDAGYIKRLLARRAPFLRPGAIRKARPAIAALFDRPNGGSAGSTAQRPQHGAVFLTLVDGTAWLAPLLRRSTALHFRAAIGTNNHFVSHAQTITRSGEDV